MCDDAENAHDHFIFAACGNFENRLERVALFGNQESYPLPPTEHSEQARSHLRGQFRMTTMERLISTGIQPLRLNTQYHMDPDVSDFPFKHSHLDDSTKEPTICDSVSVRRHTSRNTPARYLKWVARYLKKNVKDSKASVFVNVADGVCFHLRQSTSNINHRNMVAILDIIKSMENSGIPVADILVVTFYPKAVAPMQAFFDFQKVHVCVRYIDSEDIRSSPNHVVIIDCSTTGRGGDQLGRVICARTFLAALVLPRALRVVVGQRYLDGTLSSTSTNTGTKILRDFIQTHDQDNQIKDLIVWNRVLDFEDVLNPKIM
jgi:hypothetical protein